MLLQLFFKSMSDNEVTLNKKDFKQLVLNVSVNVNNLFI